jgi:hypothetical protein
MSGLNGRIEYPMSINPTSIVPSEPTGWTLIVGNVRFLWLKTAPKKFLLTQPGQSPPLMSALQRNPTMKPDRQAQLGSISRTQVPSNRGRLLAMVMPVDET